MTPFASRRMGVVAVLLLAMCPVLMGGATEREVADQRATITFRNHTSCPVFVYINGQFVERCEPCLILTLKSPLVGEVEVVGRFRCETYGPQKLTLEKGKTTRCAFRDEMPGESQASEEVQLTRPKSNS